MITPRTIKQELAGKRFSVRDVKSGSEVQFSFPTVFQQWPRIGGEGLVTPVTCHHPTKGDIPSILKLFSSYLPQRSKRQSFLVRFGLAGVHDWLYEGVPYSWIDKTVEGHRIYGHVAKHVGHGRKGDDFRIVRDTDEIDKLTEENRREMAAQLCNAVLGLEKIGITHGDLSPANIVISRMSKSDVRCVLIDYDGFHSSSVPMLPRTHNNTPIRLLGSPGYQHPTLIRKIAGDKSGQSDSVFVDSDRFALGVLCFELMTWTSQISKNLDRTHLLGFKSLENGSIDVPRAIESVWPEGLKLLRESAAQSDSKLLPGPEDWLQALGFLGKPWQRLIKDWVTTPILKIIKRSGNLTPVLVQRVEFIKPTGDSGNFSGVDPMIAGISYKYSYVGSKLSKLSITVNTANSVVIKRDGITKNLGVKPGEIDVGPGDQLLTDGWIFEFQDKSIGSN